MISAPDAFCIRIPIKEAVSLYLSLLVLQVALIAASETFAVWLTIYRVPCKMTVGWKRGAKCQNRTSKFKRFAGKFVVLILLFLSL